MQIKCPAKWVEPIDLAHQISKSDYNQNWIFLYSGLAKNIPASKSYICLYPTQEIISDDFVQLEKGLRNKENQYFGYLGYELKSQLENLKNGENSFINLPNLWMSRFGLVLEFDHEKKIINRWSSQAHTKTFILNKQKIGATQSIKIQNLSSNFTKKQYFQKVESIRKHIENGDIYQANLTRKFFGRFTKKPKNPFDIFLKLNEVSPANYSAFMRLGDAQIISSSPELFLKIDKSGNAISSPIKGTSKRFKDPKLDKKSKKDLQNNPKEQAENLMIVDLVRNDFARNCVASSVKVENLFKVSSYKTVHHLSSDICGKLDSKFSHLDLVKSCFPAGSMTGAPKIKAMQICEDLEKQNRGIYSGAIGKISAQSTELSVVIRTLIIRENKFEFQVGGAITYDSTAKNEWQETINKAKGITKTLGISLMELKKL